MKWNVNHSVDEEVNEGSPDGEQGGAELEVYTSFMFNSRNRPTLISCNGAASVHV